MGEWIFPLMARAFYEPAAWKEADAPDITDAYYSSPGREICLVFDRNVTWADNPEDGYYLKDQFFLDGESGKVAAGRVKGNKVYLVLKNPYEAKKITYLPGHFYEGTDICYQGPWLLGENKIGVLSFDNYPINTKEAQGK
jgi:hypothetical protein